MGCTPAGYKTFLVVCNFALMIFGFSIMSLGVKMQIALTALRLDRIPILDNSVKAVTATGFIVTGTGASGIIGSCYEMLWLVMAHLGGLALIVIMEFSLGVTLMVLKSTVEAALEEISCGNLCKDTLSFIIYKLATPSAGIMMTMIVMEGLMIYSAIQLYYYLKNLPKTPPAPAAGPTVVVQNVQMQNVGAPQPPQPMYAMPAPPPQAPYVNQPQFPAPPPYNPPEQPYAQPSPLQPCDQPVPQQPYAQPVPQQPYAQPVPQQPYAQPPFQIPAMEPPLDTSTLKQPTKAGDEPT